MMSYLSQPLPTYSLLGGCKVPAFGITKPKMNGQTHTGASTHHRVNMQHISERTGFCLCDCEVLFVALSSAAAVVRM